MLGAAAVAAPYAALRAGDSSSIPIGDMHAHLFFGISRQPATVRPLGKLMGEGNATLVSWALVGDQPWIRPSPRGLRQKGSPKPGAATKWFTEEIARVRKHAAQQGIKIATTPADLDLALKGEPHVVLSVEGASFLDDGIEGLEAAHKAGVRHIQLVHFVRNTIGDFQTEAPQHGGLTDFGRKVVEECNRLGILVDLAHATRPTVDQALAVAKAPLVWSHSSITKSVRANARAQWMMRQLGLDQAKQIAAKGGVVGLWGLRSDVGATPESYGDRIIEMAGWLGDDHVGFGTDMNAVANSPVASYRDLRRVVRYLERKIAADRVRKIAIGNYARVLREAMEGAKA
ncbi:MAG TPA: membrane dipeptidase [Hyphomicrobiaceae bacterium]|nr:membrane dipeptidase [Hyphomicrobiaceae bacterium]